MASFIRNHWYGLLLFCFFVLEISIFLLVPISSEFKVREGEIQVYGLNKEILLFSTGGKSNPNLVGFFNVSDEEAISVFVLDKGSYVNWKNQRNTTVLFSSRQTTFGKLDFRLNENEDYYVIFDNTFSNINKTLNLGLKVYFVPTYFGFPAAYVYRFVPFALLLIPIFLSVKTEKKVPPIVDKEIVYMLLFMTFFLGLTNNVSTSLNE